MKYPSLIEFIDRLELEGELLRIKEPVSPILEIAEMVKAAVGYEGAIENDPSKPDGTPRKLMDSSLLEETGWSSKIPLKDGIRMTYSLFLDELADGSLRER